MLRSILLGSLIALRLCSCNLVENGKEAKLHFEFNLTYESSWILYINDPNHDIVLVVTSRKNVILDPNYNMVNIKTSNTSIDITIPKVVKKKHAGTFTCGLNNHAAILPHCEDHLTITDVPTKPDIRLVNTPVFGHRAELDCVSNSTTLPPNNNMYLNYTWFRYKQRLHNSQMYSIQGSRLLLNELRSRKQYQFECRSRENNLETEPSTIQFYPEYAPYSVSFNISENKKIEKGSDIAISCRANCKPTCYYEWERDGRTLHGTDRGILTFFPTRRGNDGLYICKASNVHGQLQKRMILDVSYSSIILKQATSLRSKTINEGQDVVLNCDVDSNPAPYVSWLKGGISLKEKSLSSTLPRTEIENGVTKHVYDNVYVKPKAECSDRGIYICQAKNGIGAIAQETMEISVFCAVRLDEGSKVDLSYINLRGEPLNVTLHIISYPRPNLLGWNRIANNEEFALTKSGYQHSIVTKPNGYQHTLNLYHPKLDLTDRGEYTVKLNNNIGKSGSFKYNVKVQVPPSLPTDLTVLFIGNTYVELKWKKGFNGYAEQNFEISFKSSYDEDWTVDGLRRDENTTHTTVSNLERGTGYRFRVRAWNDIGSSGYSNEILVQTQGRAVIRTTTTLRSTVGVTGERSSHTYESVKTVMYGTKAPRHHISDGGLLTGVFFGILLSSVTVLFVAYLLIKGPIQPVIQYITELVVRLETWRPEVMEMPPRGEPEEHLYDDADIYKVNYSESGYLEPYPRVQGIDSCEEDESSQASDLKHDVQKSQLEIGN